MKTLMRSTPNIVAVIVLTLTTLAVSNLVADGHAKRLTPFDMTRVDIVSANQFADVIGQQLPPIEIAGCKQIRTRHEYVATVKLRTAKRKQVLRRLS